MISRRGYVSGLLASVAIAPAAAQLIPETIPGWSLITPPVGCIPPIFRLIGWRYVGTTVILSDEHVVMWEAPW
jgi:hypothetical protein